MEAFMHLYPCLIKAIGLSFKEVNKSIHDLGVANKRLAESFKRLSEISEEYSYEDCDCE